MKIGVLGSGDVGFTLTNGFAARGHAVVIGTRDPGTDKAQALRDKIHPGVRVVTFAEAAHFGDVLVMAIGGEHVQEALEQAGIAHFAGKVVIDPSNPLAFTAPGEPPTLTVGHMDSAGEQLQRRLPTARVVKAFNIVGYPHMVDPDFNGDHPDMFICGNDAEAKQVVDRLICELGWPPSIDLGNITQSRYLEPLAVVWITYLFNTGFNVNHAFKLLRK